MDLLHLPKHISICEVGPRDGLQNEKVSLSLEQKTELIERSIAAGVKIIEVGSFVSPKAIPSMADTDEVCRRIHKIPGVEYRSLIFNLKGLQRAEAAGLTKAKLTVSASRGHCLANMNKTPEEAVQSFSACVAYAKEHNLTLSGAISTAFGCSIDGIVPFEQVISVAKALYDLGLRELSLSDTTGMAHPVQVYQYCLDIQKIFPDVIWNLHFHNTRGLGLANVLAGMMAGITRFDACFAGLGGCPFAPGASGNIATEDLINMCNEIGVTTGIDIDQYIKIGYDVEKYIGGTRSSSILRAGKCSDIIKNKK
jgi:hydroxymethylglutaryl-CoA lyase